MNKATKAANTARMILSGLLGLAVVAGASGAVAQVWRSDSGRGTYSNPPLNADYPDPDIIRVGEDFYFASTTFLNTPGLVILHSKDLVNWDIASHVMPRLTGNPKYDLVDGGDYRHGVYAPSLRYHEGRFYIAVTPVGGKTRIYSAAKITGPWSMRELDREAFDPGLFIDNDGKAYVFTSIGSDGTITLLSLNADLSAVVDARVVHFNKGAEGSKVIRRGDWYYLFNAIPSRLGLTVSRAKSLTGPWETRPQIDDKTGGHQGALVDLPDGGWYGFVMLDAGAVGRVTNISPVFWQDDWPVWGTPEAPGRVPRSAAKPILGKPFQEPPSSDDFSRAVLGRQWQWNHNPDDRRWSLTERPGFMRLKATTSDGFWTARNTLVQKGQGPRSRGVAKLDVRGLAVGDECGLGTFGKFSSQLVVTRTVDGQGQVSARLIESTTQGPKIVSRSEPRPAPLTDLWLSVTMDFTTDKSALSYSLDGKAWVPMPGDFPLAFDWRTGTFQGEQYGLFCYNPKGGDGRLDIDSFTLGRP
ncbi:glycoside hydrolase family 43 protein [Caulobacter sp. RL271]|jgi:beta-xylosidase|uniref:Glycoside hydrolase 43 family protein n=1 Tax=Caulobacter segnis TaxID=88688 RepID=A0ABY4ZZ14_9CAUL|nr:glycoside hydrolase 43 family protein [Caulobacter segnis]USQ98047.1 glycoside hydrolase 43 family protein [Caulobacter segnis]